MSVVDDLCYHGTPKNLPCEQCSHAADELFGAHSETGHICGGEQRAWGQADCTLCGDGRTLSAERVLTIDEVEDAYNAASMYAVKEWHGYQAGNWNVKADFAAALCKLALKALRSSEAVTECRHRLKEQR